MAIGHLAVRPHSRAQGHSAAAAVAYRCGLVLTCTRTGERHDFTRRAQREDVAAYGLAGGRFESPAAFTAAIESAEKRRNSRICRDVQIALPIELDDPSRIELAEAFAAELAERYATAACWAVHRPDRRSDRRNHHAHILLPTRALAGDGCTFGKKLRVLDDQRRGPEEITEIRRLWESRANEALIAAGQDARVHTGRTTHPEPSLGAKHIAIERQAWQQRHTDFPNGLERVGGLSAARLVIDDGVCATRRGRALANHVTLRAFIAYSIGARELLRSRPVRAPASEAAQDLAHPAVALAPVPDPRPARVRGLETIEEQLQQARQGRAQAVREEQIRKVQEERKALENVVELAPVPDSRPARVHGLETIEEQLQQARQGRAQAVREEQVRKVQVRKVQEERKALENVVELAPVPDPRPARVRGLETIEEQLQQAWQGRAQAVRKEQVRKVQEERKALENVVELAPVPDPRPARVHGLETIEEQLQQEQRKRLKARKEAWMEDDRKREATARERRRQEALSRLRSAITVESVQAAGEALIEQNAGHANAGPSFMGSRGDCGLKASAAAVQALRPHVEPHHVPAHHHRTKAPAYQQYRDAVQRAIRGFRRWFLRVGWFGAPPPAERIVQELLQVAEPIHLAESEALHERITEKLAQEREREALEQRTPQLYRPRVVSTSARPRKGGVERGR